MKIINTILIVIGTFFLSQTVWSQTHSNIIGIRYSISAVDGVGVAQGRNINYTKLFSETLGYRVGYSQGMKSTSWKGSLLAARPNLLEEFISIDNTVDDVVTEYFHYHSFDFGLYYISNSYGKSNISIYGGGRYVSKHNMYIQSVGPTVESIDEKNIFSSGLGYELELAYNYQPIEQMSISLGVNYASKLGLFGTFLGLGFSF